MTRREHQVVEQLALGKTNKEIGAVLGLTEGTVKVYVRRVKQKDPEHNSRYSFVKFLVRDHERVMACRLNSWIRQWGELLPGLALAELQIIMADQVAKVLFDNSVATHDGLTSEPAQRRSTATVGPGGASRAGILEATESRTL